MQTEQIYYPSLDSIKSALKNLSGVAFETPFGKTDKILGGAATYISLSASNFNTSNKAEFGSNSNPKKNNKASLDMNQLGAVFVFNNRNNNSVFNFKTNFDTIEDNEFEISFLNYEFYLSQPWMHLKLTFVALLLFYHFKWQFIILALKKKTFKWTSNKLRIWNEVATLALVAIVFLVTLKDSLNWIKGTIGFFAVAIALMILIKMYKRIRLKKGTDV